MKCIAPSSSKRISAQRSNVRFPRTTEEATLHLIGNAIQFENARPQQSTATRETTGIKPVVVA